MGPEWCNLRFCLRGVDLAVWNYSRMDHNLDLDRFAFETWDIDIVLNVLIRWRRCQELYKCEPEHKSK